MKKNIFIVIGFLWAVLVAVYFYRGAYGLGIRNEFTNENDNFTDGEDVYVINNTEDDAYLFRADASAKVENIIRVSSYAIGTKAVALCDNQGASVMIYAKSTLDDEEVDVYNILHFDRRDQIKYMTGWFTPDRYSKIIDFVPSGEGYILYFLSDSEEEVYFYEITEDMILDVDDDYLQERREVTALEITGATVNDGTYLNDAAKVSQMVKGMFGKLKFSFPQIVQINHRLFVNCFSALVIGIVLLIALYIVLKKKNRVAYMILIWEAMLIIFLVLESYGFRYFAIRNGRIIGSLLAFVIESAIGIFVILLISLDLSMLSSAMGKLVMGDTEIRKPITYGEDMESLWNGLLDLCRLIRNINYKKFRVFENYYRFAPKNIENIIGKPSITEVHNGDKVVKRGDVAVIRYSPNGGSYDDLKNVIDVISSYQESGYCSLVGCSQDLTGMTLAFADGCGDTVNLAANLVKVANGRLLVLLTNFEYVYGVVGNEKQQIPYLLSPRFNLALEVADVFEKLKLGLVITDKIYISDDIKANTRYIGYLADENNTRVYEVLDVLSAAERRDRREYDEIFQKGVELFENQDFYLARNEFANIIKKNPADQVARWYLFKAESYLDSELNDDIKVSIN